MSGPSHKLYVDDSGTKDYSEDGTYPPEGGNTRYFVFAGLLVIPSEAGNITTKMRLLKKQAFGTEDIEIKANWLKRPQERKERYLEKYGISEEALNDFVDKTYGVIENFDGEIIASIIDKPELQKLHGSNAWYAPAAAYEFLMQRAQYAMAGKGGTVSITVDDMSGATPKGNQFKENLVVHHKKLKASGSQLLRGVGMNRLADLGFSDSVADERLQLADLAAHAVYRQFVDYGEGWDGEEKELKTYPYFDRIGPKFRRGPGNIISGYGIVKFPRSSKKQWVIKEDEKREP